jgi:hypothetical protein
VDILVFSDSRRAEGYFRISRRSERFSLPRFLPLQDLKAAVRASDRGSFIYLDLNGLEGKKMEAHLRLLAKNDHVYYGLLDPAGKIKDVAALFQQGASDYAGKSVLQEGITARRMNRVFRYLQEYPQASRLRREGEITAQAAWGESDQDWENIVAGQEYLFTFMFVELDGKEEMVKNYGRDNLDIALNSFRSFIERGVKPFGGRIWIWSHFGGIVLFPFNRNRRSPIECAYRLVLFKHFYDIEESLFPHFISFRIAMHLGRTIYDIRNTGHIVSEPLNSVFHLGQQFASRGNTFVSEDILPIIPTAFKSYFLDAGVFEGRKIFRMRRPLHSGGGV